MFVALGIVLYGSLVNVSTDSKKVVYNDMVSRDSGGVSDMFIITAAGQSVDNGSPTPTVTITPTPAPTAAPTVVPTPTVTATVTVTPTPTPTPRPTATPSPTAVVTPYPTDDAGVLYNPNPGIAVRPVKPVQWAVLESSDWGKSDYVMGETARAHFVVRNTGASTIHTVLVRLVVYKLTGGSDPSNPWTQMNAYGIPFEDINLGSMQDYAYDVNMTVPSSYQGGSTAGSYRIVAELTADGVYFGQASGEYNIR